MILIRRILAVALAGILAAGCASSEPAKFEAAVHAWVPLGTPVKKAEEIMKHHGFECHLVRAESRFNPTGKTYLDCEKPNSWMHNWNARFFFVDDKVAEYGEISVE